MKTASEAIERVDDLTRTTLHHCHRLHEEAYKISTQWRALRQAGGARDDHAATLLARLDQPLGDLAQFCELARTQITQLAADPFGDNPQEPRPCVPE